MSNNGKAAPRSQTFMFIDASQTGVNVKPDKAVRSFVMHQARRLRPWSTRKAPVSPDPDGNSDIDRRSAAAAAAAGVTTFKRVRRCSTQEEVVEGTVDEARQPEGEEEEEEEEKDGKKESGRGTIVRPSPPSSSWVNSTTSTTSTTSSTISDRDGSQSRSSTPSSPSDYAAPSPSPTSSASTSSLLRCLPPNTRHVCRCRPSHIIGTSSTRPAKRRRHECVCSLRQAPPAPDPAPPAAFLLRQPYQVAIGVLDPFDSLAVPIDAKSSWLIDHFATTFSPRLLPLDIRQSSTAATNKWLSRALQDCTSGRSMAYAILCSTALHLHLMGASTLDRVLHYKGLAISEINSNLSNPKRSVSDNNIAAVFLLLCMEESMLALSAANPRHSQAELEWNERHKLVHLNGLRAMIQQRGGLSALSTDRCLQVFILMHSIAHSVASFHRPYTTLLDDSGNPCQYDIPSFCVVPSNSRIWKPYKDLNLDPELMEIIGNVLAYTSDLSLWLNDQECSLDALDLQKHSSLLMYRLFDWYDCGDKRTVPVDQCICLALLIFVVRTAQPHGHSYRTMATSAVRRLQEALQKTRMSHWTNAPDLLLWTLTMGGLAATGASEMEFYTQHCAVAFVDAGFNRKSSCEELLQRMKNCPWISSVFDEDAGKLWKKIGLLKGTVEDELVEEFALLSTDIREDDKVGLLTSNRFFLRRK